MSPENGTGLREFAATNLLNSALNLSDSVVTLIAGGWVAGAAQ